MENVHKILIIDDESYIHDAVKKLFPPKKNSNSTETIPQDLFGVKKEDNNWDVEFISALNGEDGFNFYKSAKKAENPISVVMCDMRMPGWDGMKTSMKIAEFDPTVILFICTAFFDFDIKDLQKNIKMKHMLEVVNKPFNPKKLKEFLIKNLENAKMQKSLLGN